MKTIWLDLPKYEDPCSEVLLYSKVVIFAKLIALDYPVAKAILRIPHHTFFPGPRVSHYPQFVKGPGNSGVFTVQYNLQSLDMEWGTV